MADFKNPYEDLPDDPELAFLQLEEHFRDECESKIRNAHQEERVDVYYVDYIAQILAAINELGLQAEFQDRVPRIEDVDYNTYLNFNKDVKHYRTMLEIRNHRRAQGYSVRLDTAARSKIHHHLEQVRAIFEKLEIDKQKREDLFQYLNDLQDEVDRDRTHFDRLAALTIAAASVGGQALEKSKILDLLDKIAQVFSSVWGNEPKRLNRSTPPKQIEPPRVPLSSKKTRELDDEIPF